MKGYYGTCSFAKQSIDKRGLDPEATDPRNDHWLGKGVYFFEDIVQAKWWATITSNKNYGSFPVVYGASIVADSGQVLNLDNNDEQVLFRQFIQENLEAVDKLCKEANRGYPVFDKRQFKGIFYDYYKRMFGIKVVIYTFAKDFAGYLQNYPNNKAERQIQRDLSRVLGISFNEKQICVSDQDCIKDCKVIEDVEEAEII